VANKSQAAIDTAIDNLTPDEIKSLTSHGADSEVFARPIKNADPYWPKAIVAHLN